MEMRLRRKGPGSYLSDTEDSLSDINDTQTLPANTTTRVKKEKCHGKICVVYSVGTHEEEPEQLC